ncbi:uncharacterized protein F13E9.13, mitochondrial isoform X2 [Wyeomyia smithii]|nr:uncharacterized protein F13E9.13, mitochondrial isoform X2 [Wyeomyia smithii]
MARLKALFSKKFPIIGMIHVDPLPGTPLYSNQFEDTIKKAKHEAEIYVKGKIDAILIENMHDLPYVQSKFLGPETVACMSRIAVAVKEVIHNILPCGIQILACGNKEALAIAKACDLDFIRTEGFVFSHVADEGVTNADAGHILRYRKHIDAQHVGIITDIKKKHSSHAITNDVSLCETAKAAEFFLSDGLVLTGKATGYETDIDDIKSLKGKVNLPLILGSGVTMDNIDRYWKVADAAIVGSFFKTHGTWQNNVDEERVRSFMNKIVRLRKGIL